MGHKTHRNAIVFTLFYPYSTFDYYVDIEIEKICNNFNTVYIIPISIEKSIERELPKNATLLESNFTPKPFKALLTAVFSKYYWKELFLALRKRKLNNALFKHLTLQYSKVSFLKSILKQKLIEDADIRWVYSHWLLEGVYAAAILKDKYNFELISKAHSLDIYKERHINSYIPFLENTVSKINQIHFISDLGRDYFNQNYKFKFPQQQQFVSRLGIRNTTPLKNYETKSTFKIISVSYIYPLKRVDLILEAIAQIKDFNIEWHHIGAYYTEHTENIKNKAKQLLDKRNNVKIVWLGDFSIPQVYEHYNYNEFDLFLSASSSEGIPVSMMECMSFGIPVLSTDVGGVKEIVDHGINGYLVDSDATALSIAELISTYYHLSQTQKSTMRLNAYQKWKNYYNADINFDKFLKIAIPPST